MADMMSELELFEKELKEIEAQEANNAALPDRNGPSTSNTKHFHHMQHPSGSAPAIPSVHISVPAQTSNFQAPNSFYPHAATQPAPPIQLSGVATIAAPPSQTQQVFSSAPVRNVPDDFFVEEPDVPEERAETPRDAPERKPVIPAAVLDPSGKVPFKQRKLMARKAAGQTWLDPTLIQWPENDFRAFCGDLGNEVNDDVLSKAFTKYPSFNMARVIRDKRTGKTKGFGFVSFSDQLDLAKAMKEMNGKYVGNRPIKMRKSTWSERSDPEFGKKKGWMHAKQQKKHIMHT